MHALKRNPKTKSLDELAYDLEVAKSALTIAKQQVEDAEAALLEAVPTPLEGSETSETQFYKITTTGKLNRALDAERLPAVQGRIPAAIFDRVIKFKPELSLRDLRFVEANEPDLYAIFAEAITTKPAKTAVKVERLTGDAA